MIAVAIIAGMLVWSVFFGWLLERLDRRDVQRTRRMLQDI
jgi:hypothetical protein